MTEFQAPRIGDRIGSSLQDGGRRAEDAMHEVASKQTVSKLARAGYAAKGFVYVLIGALALKAAVAAGGATTGSDGALRILEGGPLGSVLLALTLVGLVGYVLWRLIQASVDPENETTGDWGWVKRGMFLISGLAYGALALKAFQLLTSSSGGGGGDETQMMTERLLSQPFGPWLVAIVALAVAFRGASQIRTAYTASFMEKLRGSGTISRGTMRGIGRIGLAARGIVFLMFAGFLMWAAIDSDARHARGLEGTLDTVAGASSGPWLLAATAAGLIAYGLFQGVKARYRVVDGVHAGDD